MTVASVSIRGLYAWSFTLLFVALKLTDQIDWNWLLVTAPAWGRYLLLQGMDFYAFKRSKQNEEQQVEPANNDTPAPTGTYL